MNWLRDLFKHKVCLTRVLEHEHYYSAQVRFAFFWSTLEAIDKAEYDYGEEYEEDQRSLVALRLIAKMYASKYNGHYLGTVEYKSLRDKIRAKFRAKFTGPCGVQGARGDMGMPGEPGPEGPRGRSYDDIQCPHCDTYRTDIKPLTALNFDHFGEDVPLVYTCKFSKCGRQSNWIAYNGIFLNVGTITRHDSGSNTETPNADSSVS